MFLGLVYLKRILMKIENTQILESNLQKVWDSLHDEQVLKECIPGCESLIKTSENSYSVTIRIKISAMTGEYVGSIQISNVSPLEEYTMVVEGTGSGGTVKATVTLSFNQVKEGTEIHISGDTTVSGIIARVGQRILGGASRMLINQFFGCIRDKVQISA